MGVFVWSEGWERKRKYYTKNKIKVNKVKDFTILDERVYYVSFWTFWEKKTENTKYELK